jgi:tRNA pseudouridine55 synthase
MKTRIEGHGVLLIDKPGGMTTFDLIRRMQRRYRFKRLGHTGTLDPLATGLVLLCANEATKLARYLTDGWKTYDCGFVLGERRDTLDADGQVVEEAPVPELSPEQVSQALAKFRGEISQVPPAYSAVKVDGKSLHKYARKGEQVTVEARQATVDALDLLEGEGANWSFRATVSAGTYIRVLVDEIGRALGTFAYVKTLRRVRNAGYEVAQGASLDELLDLGPGLEERLISPADALSRFPRVQPDPDSLHLFRNGGFIACPEEIPDEAAVAVLEADGRLSGVGRPHVATTGPNASDERVLKPERLLLP